MTRKERADDLYRIRRYLTDECARWLVDNGFLDAPASSRFHGCYAGGLFDHSIAVLRTLLTLTKHNKLSWGRKESPYIIAMLHDVCKIDQYELVTYANGDRKYKYADTEIKGHGTKSVIYAKWMIPDLTAEEEACIRWHMGAFGDREEQDGYGEAVKQYPNVLWTHTADMLSAIVDNM